MGCQCAKQMFENKDLEIEKETPKHRKNNNAVSLILNYYIKHF